ncbi:MAG: rhomboid family intramembrane serine protease [Chloroflexi bacterium]|nr:rhomboid family intramembrane serine protease [Chloroflexota bacterium]
MESSSQVSSNIIQIQSNASTLIIMISVMGLLRFLDAYVLRGRLNKNYCNVAKASFRPHTFFTAAILHRDRNHLFGNSISFFTLGFLTMLPNVRDFYITTLITMVLEGFLTWRFGPKNTGQIGASGVVFGYFGFLLSRGFFAKDTGAVLLALAVFLILQSLTFQIFPNRPGVTKLGHFFGFISGIVSAWVVSLLPSV